MRELYENWHSSGLSQKAFALQNQIAPSTFYYWVKKFRQPGELTAKGFSPILMESVPIASPPLAVIHYPSGVSVEWQGGADTLHLLKSLL